MEKESTNLWLLRFIVIMSDIVVLNAIMLILNYTNICRIPSPSLTDGKLFFLIVNLTYLISISLKRPILYTRNVHSDKVLERVFTTILIFFILLFSIFILLNTNNYGVKWWICYIAAIFIGIAINRLTLRFLIRYYRRRNGNIRTIIFVGDGLNMRDLWQELLANSASGYRAKGYFDDNPNADLSDKMQYSGKICDVIPFLEKQGRVDEIYCSLPSARAEEISQIINYCEKHVVFFYSVPNVRNYLRRQMNMKLIGDVPVLFIHKDPLSRYDNRFLKRTFDIIVSIIVLIFIFPWIFIIVSIIMKLTMPGPIFFVQKRSGLSGKIFNCYKFRSMKVNNVSDDMQATKNDPRKTRFGNFMRHTNIDELPQFFNVLKNDMSIVGPRPHMVKQTAEYAEMVNKYMLRHMIKPGITGWAQVSGFRGETKELRQMENRIKADVWYIENWSFWLDVRIIYLTVKNIFTGDKNAY